MDDVAVEEEGGNQDALGEDAVEDEHRRFGGVADPLDFRLVEVDVADAVLVHDELLLVVALGHVGVDDDGFVVRGGEVAVTVGLELLRDAFDLPRRAGAAGVPCLPRDVDLEDGLAILGERGPIAGQVHEAADVLYDGLRPGAQDGHFAFARKVMPDHSRLHKSRIGR